jgi:hypothetical protein
MLAFVHDLQGLNGPVSIALHNVRFFAKGDRGENNTIFHMTDGRTVIVNEPYDVVADMVDVATNEGEPEAQ